MLSRLSLFLARTSLTAWVGAAVLFVVVGVSEVIHAGFSSEIRDQLVVIRFPWYYRFGIAMMSLAFLGTLGIPAGCELSRWRKMLATWLLAVALVIFIVEYVSVYQPLAELVTPPGKPRTPEFMTYHRLSMWVNLADLVLCLIAAGLLNWPGKDTAASSSA